MPTTIKYITLNEENFEAEVLNSTIPVVVDFWAAWCGPCRVMNPVVTQLAEEFEGVVKVGKLNVDDYPELADKYHIQAIPALIFFKQGEVVEHVAGMVSKPSLVEKLNTLADKQVEPIA